MGFCYMLQYIDKLALSQATLFNIRQDLVPFPLFVPNPMRETPNVKILNPRAYKIDNITGHLQYFTLGISPGAGPAPT
jgi:hypothetical protein